MQVTKKRYNDMHRDNIIRYIEAGGDGNTEGVAITEYENKLLQRWIFADEKLRENKYKRQVVVNLICSLFKVGNDTAWRDVVNAEVVFCSTRPLNKKSINGRRIEYIESLIYKLVTDRDFETAVKWEKELREYLRMYPETERKQSPKNIILLFQQNIFETKLSAEEALSYADELAQQLEKQDDY